MKSGAAVVDLESSKECEEKKKEVRESVEKMTGGERSEAGGVRRDGG